MWIRELSLQNFRNYCQLSVKFHNGLNVFLGKNAQGKTNILESIYFLALTRSHRTRTDKDLLPFGGGHLAIHGLVCRTNGNVPLDIELTEKGRTTKINHLKQNRLSDYIGHMNVILFAPEDLQLIKGTPALRRKFMDVELGQIKPLYLFDLANYNHVLKQRNTYLKQEKTIDDYFLDVLDSQLADYGSKVILHRLEFLEKLETYAKEKHSQLSSDTEKLSLQYRSSFKFTDTVNLVDTLLTELRGHRKRDLFKKNTGVGPHRDDIEFFINDMNARYGSQGQHRSFILSVKLAEIELMKEITGEYPILLLDDVMSELDRYRQEQLLKTISEKIQTFITTTSLEHLHQLPESLKIFYIESGTLIEKAK